MLRSDSHWLSLVREINSFSYTISKTAGDSTSIWMDAAGRIVESGACLRSMSCCDLWVRLGSFAPIDFSPHNIMEIIIFSHAVEGTSIQSVILHSFSSLFLFSYSVVFLCIFFLLEYLLAASHNIHKISF